MFAFTSLICVFAQDVHEIIQRSVAAQKRDWDANPDYDYSTTVKKGGHSKTFDVPMIDGSPCQILLDVDGKPVSSQLRTYEEEKIKQATEQRKRETRDQRANRIAAWKRQQQRDHFLMQQMVKAFNFKLQGTDELEGHKVYVLAATPKPDYRPPNHEAKVLTGMKGTMWVDQQTSQWVKVEAEVTRPVSIEGVLARVEPGTRFELREAPITTDIWLPTYFAVKAHAEVFFVFGKNSAEEDTYFDYRKAPASETGTPASGQGY
ncbi:MAG TPA: hypothetical protein VKW78_01735 [Terriglobales bacterium]|nr:hypothetical protein [Terriglobales bacterium]